MCFYIYDPGVPSASKPDRVFDRDAEWGRLASFAAAAGSGPRLGVVTGRRRQGKTYLLDALTRATDGFYFGATEATETVSLTLLGDALARRFALPAPPRLADWDAAVRHLVTASELRGVPIVLDEFSYLAATSPALPSILQREIDRAAAEDLPVRLLLCGSVMSVMGKLLSGNAPLRGRATLELVLRPFEFPLATRYWGVPDARAAVLLNAVVGGTPAYRRFVNDDHPVDEPDFDRWVLESVLDPASPLFREARYLLAEDATVRDPALYHSVLAAVAAGNATRGGIAAYVGRQASDIGHHLTVLEDARLLTREPDVFRSGRAVYRLAEPILTFYQVVMSPQWGLLESGRADLVWRHAAPRFASQVVGPHFERLCREHAVTHGADLFDGLPAEVGSGVVADPANRTQIEIDVAVLAPAEPGRPRVVLSLGEAKWGKRLGQGHLDRLRRARDLLATRGYDTSSTVLACYGGGGFADDVAAGPDRVLRIGPDDLVD